MAPDARAQANYRPDVDGLRAIAIVLVVVYHAFPSAVRGGFIGVDVFFVISGYLITGILYRSLEAGRLGWLEFLGRRARRILPALTLVLVATLAVGTAVLFPDEFRLTGRDVAAGASFVSNLVARHFADAYFGSTLDEHPLMHLWSLGIEEQFYIVWPATMWLLWRLDALTWRTTAALALFSFAFDVYRLRSDPVGAFYAPELRAWELLMGASLILAERRSARREGADGSPLVVNGSAALGWLLILAASVLLSGQSPYPGVNALAPTIGTALLIGPGARSRLSLRLLSARPMVFVGLVSYPFYLWHWPALTYLRLLGHGGAVAAACGLLVSFGLAVATYELIERPLRRVRLSRAAIPALAALGIIGVIGYTGYRSRWLPPAARVAGADNWEYPDQGDLPKTGTGLPYQATGASRPTREVLFIGDSHLEQYWPRVRVLQPQLVRDGTRVTFVTWPGCGPLPNSDRLPGQAACADFLRKALAVARQSRYSTVVFAAYWERYLVSPKEPTSGARPVDVDPSTRDGVLSNFSQALATLSRDGKSVVVIGSNPTGAAFDPKRIIRRGSWQVARAEPVAIGTLEPGAGELSRQLRLAAAAAGARFVDPVDFLCSPVDCPVLGRDGRPVSRDSNHLRTETAARLTLIDSVLARPTQ